MPLKPGKQLAATCVAVVVLVLAAGLWLGGHPAHLPGFMDDVFVEDHQTRVVDEAIRRIQSDYYRPVSRGELSDASIKGAIASLKDRFSRYLDPKEFHEFSSPPHFTGIGVEVTPDPRGLLIARVFDSSPALRAGLKAGELIVAVNGRDLHGVAPDAAKNMIRGRPGTDVRLGISSHDARGRTRTVSITRATISEPVVASASRTVQGKKLAIVALATFSPGAHGEVRQAVERALHDGARGILLDLRANGGGLVDEAQLIASTFIAKGTIVSMRGRTQPSQTLVAVGDAIAESVPMVVLVDANTASAAEIVTAALQDHRRATVVGTHTFGKGVFQEEEQLSNRGALDITVGEYFTPSGRNLGGGGVKQGAGITPDVKIAKGVDTPRGLDTALRTLAAKVR